MTFGARDLATLDVPTEPLALRARLPSTPRADSPLVQAWEAHRAAWAELAADVRAADVRAATDAEFRRRHRCPGPLTSCPYAARVA